MKRRTKNSPRGVAASTISEPPQETGAHPEERAHPDSPANLPLTNRKHETFQLSFGGAILWSGAIPWKKLPNWGWLAVYDEQPVGYLSSSRLLVAKEEKELWAGLQRLHGEGKIRNLSHLFFQTAASKDDLTDPEHERRVWTPSEAPVNYKQKLRAARLMNNFEGALIYGEGWPVVKELARTEDPLKERELRNLLWDEHPEAAEKLGAPVPKAAAAVSVGETVGSPPASPNVSGESLPIRNGQRCARIIGQIRRAKNMCLGSGRTIAEIQQDFPDWELWKVIKNLPAEDQETFAHPNRWGPVVGYGHGLLAKEYGKSPATIRDWIKAWRQRQGKKSRE